MIPILLLLLSYIATASAGNNYTSTRGDVIIGQCIMLPKFLNTNQPLCNSERYGKWFDSTLNLMEYNQEVTLQCSTRVQYQYLEDFTFPYFAAQTTKEIVWISYCPAPKGRYVDVIKPVNLTIDGLTELRISRLRIKPILKASAFEGLNITDLWLEYDPEVLARPRVPNDIVQYMSTLSTLRVYGAELSSFPNTSVVRKLKLSSGSSLGALGGCSWLQELEIHSWDVQSLDSDEEERGWISGCNQLKNLKLSSPNVDTLYRVLTNASSLRTLEIIDLPDRMFEIDIGVTRAIYLQSVKISNSDIFRFQIVDAVFPFLTDLDLTKNNFDSRALTYLHAALEQAVFVTNITLSRNPNFDLCEANSKTDPKAWTLWLPNLKRLVASFGATTALCFGDLNTTSLELLDLSNCRVKNIDFTGLPKLNNGQLVLWLENNFIEEVKFQDGNYNKYLETDSPEKPREMVLRELHLKGNRIQNFTANSLPDTFKFLDLRFNVISYIDDITANALFLSADRHLKLDGNAFVCDCQNQVFLSALNDHKNQVDDYESLTCATDGQLISNVTISNLCPEKELEFNLLRVLLPVVLILAAFIALLTAIFFKYSQPIKVFLYARGLFLCCLKEEELDSNRPFDVFISFSHDDEEYVLNELMPGLEKSGYKTCVHMRDWVVGEWIPKQIAASIELSRRTLVVLSEAFVESQWGMLEFRMAHARSLSEGRARLLLLLLGDKLPQQMTDPELRGYLRTNTYLSAKDPRFWDKLRFALPRHGRPAPPPRETNMADVPSDLGPYGGIRSDLAMDNMSYVNDSH